MVKLDISIVFNATPLVKSFYKIYWLKVFNICQKANSHLLDFFSFYEETQEEFVDESDVESDFYQEPFDIFQSNDRIVRVSKGSKKKSFEVILFQFCNWKLQHRYILQKEVNISKIELFSFADRLRDVLKKFDKASKCLHIPLPKPDIEIGFTQSQKNHFTLYCRDITEHLNRQNRLSFRFKSNSSCLFSIKKFELHGSQILRTETVNLNHSDHPYFYRNIYCITNK